MLNETGRNLHEGNAGFFLLEMAGAVDKVNKEDVREMRENLNPDDQVQFDKLSPDSQKSFVIFDRLSLSKKEADFILGLDAKSFVGLHNLKVDLINYKIFKYGAAAMFDEKKTK
jgi:hypothetical protein